MKINWNEYIFDAGVGISYWSHHVSKRTWVEDSEERDGENGLTFTLTPELFELGAARVKQAVAEGHRSVTYREIVKELSLPDPDLDAVYLDVIVQFAVFGELVYG